MTKSEFERLRIFLRVHDPKVEDYNAGFRMQDGSYVRIRDPKTMRIEGELFYFDKQSIHRKNIQCPVCFWAAPRAPYSTATYF